MTSPDTRHEAANADLDPDAVAAAVLACPSVTGLSGGRLGEVATYLPGRRITGVRIADDGVAVHLVGRYGPTIGEIAAEVRAAVQAVVGRRPVTVSVDDLDTSGLPLAR